MNEAGVNEGVPHRGDGSTPRQPPSSSDASNRLRRLVREQQAFVWRVLRRFAVPESEADDAAQEVFVVLARKIDLVSEGQERAFLFQTAIHVASHARRSLRRRREDGTSEVPDQPDSSPNPEEALVSTRRLALLDAALDTMSDDLRRVFVLCDLEQISMIEAAAILEIPQGTVASRLRRAREQFSNAVRSRVAPNEGMR